ncbi:COG4315 family predicted lipoprotein [Achromobacter aloeverae]|uniref:Lipoprotein with Yx(FWY)xxD motif n=1 Tax=Achromobacter aloeverae TaxID=1750518 RepID=A0A4Q1HGL9_9BURK|nr:hypothetical protein [Achromobacter aloeverae]RXN86240.1 hypothetical protein C7R54_21190 [Achromobacter aloeverae]
MVRTFSFSALGLAAVLMTGTAFAAPPAKVSNGVLVGDKGMTLYTFDNDKDGKSACNGGCATNWPPFAAPASAKAEGDWSVITRDDGSKQWAIKGKPLYYWTKDKAPGDKTGDGFKDVWHAAKP